ncbi:MAG: GGDEF domain-containing protein, partial [Polyangia bacterium]
SAVKLKIRREDLFARYGGEEFAIVLPEISLDAARTFAEKVRQLVQDQEFRFENTSIDVTISMGVAGVNENVREVEGLIKLADDQLYAAKAAGRNQVLG